MTTNNSVNTTLVSQSGTGAFAGTTSPTFVTPALGTPASGVLTNCTGLPIAGGGTGVTSVTTTPTASSFAGWDASSNLSANNFLRGYTTTATAASTTTLTVASTQQQFFTGSSTQSVVLPVTSTLVLGQSYMLINNSTGIVTVKSSDGTAISILATGTQATFTCILTSGTTPASWNSDYGGMVPWTPVFTFATLGDLTVVYTVQAGFYTKSGNMIYANFNLAFTPTFTTSASIVTITGLPLISKLSTGNVSYGSCLISAPAFPVGTTSIYCYNNAGTSTVLLGASGTATAAANFSVTQFTTGVARTVNGSLSYLI